MPALTPEFIVSSVSIAFFLFCFAIGFVMVTGALWKSMVRVLRSY